LSSEEVWFSHRERIYEVKNGKFNWTDKEKIWNWDNCTIGLARTLKNEFIVVVRSNTNKNSRHMGDAPVRLRFMLGFEVINVSEPICEHPKRQKDSINPGEWDGAKDRWVFKLNEDYWIWEWAKEGSDIESSRIYKRYRRIKSELSNPSIEADNIFDISSNREDNAIWNQLNKLDKKFDGIPIPVIYQPAVDSLKNFVREVHCDKSKKVNGSYEVEVTIIFNNEHLRKHSFLGLNEKYENFRRWYYGRALDVETFKILVRKNVKDNRFTFENIYSGECQLDEDSKHGDEKPAPERDIKYYFIDHNHPVIFINTSNHAMAEKDRNKKLWKWEYIPWVTDAPIILGTKSRKEIDSEFKSVKQTFENLKNRICSLF